jgi:hypothetical protein
LCWHREWRPIAPESTVLVSGLKRESAVGIARTEARHRRNAARAVEITPDPSNVLVLFPFMICVGLIRDRVLAASALEELVERLGRERSPAGVEEAMRDPSLKLLLWSSSTSSYVDVRGGRVHLPEDDAGRSVTRIDRDRRPVAAIVHDPALDGNRTRSERLPPPR